MQFHAILILNVRINLEKVDGVEKFELFGKFPNKYRHFLPSQRQ